MEVEDSKRDAERLAVLKRFIKAHKTMNVFLCLLLAGGLSLFTLERVFGFMLVTVSGDSMKNALKDGDICIFKYTKLNEISNDDIVALKVSQVDEGIIVKRVIGKPMDTVEFVDGDLFVNGEETYRYGDKGYENLSATVGRNELFLMGDNTSRSYDSRYFGCVKVDGDKVLKLVRVL